MAGQPTPTPLGAPSVGEILELIGQRSFKAVRERLGSDLVLLPLEPWVLSARSSLKEATLTGRSQLVRTTLGRQAPAVAARPYPIPALPLVQLGRSRQAAMRIDQPTISRIHAELLVADGTVNLRDGGSYNGTLLNGRILGPGELATLSDGDVITLGEAQLLFGSLTHLATLLPTAK